MVFELELTRCLCSELDGGTGWIEGVCIRMIRGGGYCIRGSSKILDDCSLEALVVREMRKEVMVVCEASEVVS